MPIYEYTCKNCNHSFERIQKVTDTPETHCEACGQATAIRLVSAPGFQLKGTGWYVTDFKDKPKTEKKAVSSNNKETKIESKTETKAEIKTEAKPQQDLKTKSSTSGESN